MVLRYSALAGWGRSRSSLRTFPVLLTTSSAPVFNVSDFVIEWREEEPDYGSALLDHQLLTGLSVVDDHSHLEQTKEGKRLMMIMMDGDKINEDKYDTQI